jgi:hypothetical protein
LRCGEYGGPEKIQDGPIRSDPSCSGRTERFFRLGKRCDISCKSVAVDSHGLECPPAHRRTPIWMVVVCGNQSERRTSFESVGTWECFGHTRWGITDDPTIIAFHAWHTNRTFSKSDGAETYAKIAARSSGGKSIRLWQIKLPKFGCCF